MRYTQKMALVVLAVTAVVGSARASGADKLFPGKVKGKAEIRLSTKTRFSSFVLPPGQYVLEHRVDGGGAHDGLHSSETRKQFAISAHAQSHAGPSEVHLGAAAGQSHANRLLRGRGGRRESGCQAANQGGESGARFSDAAGSGADAVVDRGAKRE